MKRLILGLGVIAALALPSIASASPFGQGVFGADVPFGSLTSLSIDLGSDVPINLTPSGGNFSGNGSHTINVTSTDVVGYQLYVQSPGSTNMVNGANTIPASSNSTAAALSVNSWGYNTTGSTTNFIGMTTTPKLLVDADGPFKSGDSTVVTYGALTDITKPAGSYSVTVVYTAVAKTD
jgi:hypothetical protein